LGLIPTVPTATPAPPDALDVDAGVIDDARRLQSRRRRRRSALVVAILVAAFVAHAVGGGGSPKLPTTPSDSSPITPVVHAVSFRSARGRAEASFTIRERSGVILLARVSARRGVRAYVDATIPGIAGVTIATVHNSRDPSLSCRLHGGMDVCTQAEQWCPMPAATWRLHVVKERGPAGPVLIDFVVGPKPRGGHSA
jgi:hypothetical protein